MTSGDIKVRHERPGDETAIHAVNRAAFGRGDEAKLTDHLRRSVGDCLFMSLVAVEDAVIVGHILFTEVTVHFPDGRPAERGAGLAPMAVRPDRQRRGIGTRLVRAGLERCESLGVRVVVVLGHPGYYPRFGFVPSVQHGVRWEHEAPPEAFMVHELGPGALERWRGGVVRYRPEFSA